MEQVTLLVEVFSITVAIWCLDFLCSIRLLGFTLLCSQRSAEFAKRSLYDARHYGPSLILFTTYHTVIKLALDF